MPYLQCEISIQKILSMVHCVTLRIPLWITAVYSTRRALDSGSSIEDKAASDVELDISYTYDLEALDSQRSFEELQNRV